LNVETTNGSVDLIIPEDYAASLEIGTGMGDIDGNVYQKVNTKAAVAGGRQICTDLNGGGSPIRVMTAVGNVSLRYSAKLR
jgi:predicted membrane protein